MSDQHIAPQPRDAYWLLNEPDLLPRFDEARRGGDGPAREVPPAVTRAHAGSRMPAPTMGGYDEILLARAALRARVDMPAMAKAPGFAPPPTTMPAHVWRDRDEESRRSPRLGLVLAGFLAAPACTLLALAWIGSGPSPNPSPAPLAVDRVPPAPRSLVALAPSPAAEQQEPPFAVRDRGPAPSTGDTRPGTQDPPRPFAQAAPKLDIELEEEATFASGPDAASSTGMRPQGAPSHSAPPVAQAGPDAARGLEPADQRDPDELAYVADAGPFSSRTEEEERARSGEIAGSSGDAPSGNNVASGSDDPTPGAAPVVADAEATVALDPAAIASAERVGRAAFDHLISRLDPAAAPVPPAEVADARATEIPTEEDRTVAASVMDASHRESPADNPALAPRDGEARDAASVADISAEPGATPQEPPRSMANIESSAAAPDAPRTKAANTAPGLDDAALAPPAAVSEARVADAPAEQEAPPTTTSLAEMPPPQEPLPAVAAFLPSRGGDTPEAPAATPATEPAAPALAALAAKTTADAPPNRGTPQQTAAAAAAPVPRPAPADAASAKFRPAAPQPPQPPRVTRAAAATDTPQPAAAPDSRCRAIIMKAQLGEETTHAERSFLRSGCGARR